MTHAQRKLIVPGTVVALIAGLALLAPLLPLYDVRAMDIPHRFAGPSAAHWLGQDDFGRDVASRLVWGGRASLVIAFGAALCAAVLGTTLGLLGGYFRGLVELCTVRASEVILCLPPLLLALMVVAILGAGTWPLILALTLLYTPNYARVVYAATAQIRGLDFVTAQQAMGTPPLLVLVRTILPNVMPPLLVQMSLVLASAMVIESGLSFLGLGVVPPTPSWGLMIRSARTAMDVAPMLLVWPSLALAGTILSVNLFCDRLQMALDPRQMTAGGALWLRRRRGRKPRTVARPEAPLLALRDLSIAAPGLELVKSVGFTLHEGQTLALVGESGSGKTLTGLALTGLLADSLRVTGGEALYRPRSGPAIDLASLDEDGFRALRGGEIAMVFQDAGSALNPVLRIGEQLAEAIRAHHRLPPQELQSRVIELLRHVGIPDPETRQHAYPHEMSGGQRQRAMIAIAIANSPRLLIADEPTTALDPTIQAQILRLFARLKAETPGMGILFVTHDLAVVSEIADRVCVMYAGQVVEEGPVAQVFARPKHPYTKALLAAVPVSGEERLSAIPGAVPSPLAMPQGCRFAPRCAQAMAHCAQAAPRPVRPAPDRLTRCFEWEDVS